MAVERQESVTTGVRRIQVSVLGSTPKGRARETPSVENLKKRTATPVAALVSAGSTVPVVVKGLRPSLQERGFIILPPDQIRLLDTALALVTSTGTARPV